MSTLARGSSHYVAVMGSGTDYVGAGREMGGRGGGRGESQSYLGHKVSCIVYNPSHTQDVKLEFVSFDKYILLAVDSSCNTMNLCCNTMN